MAMVSMKIKREMENMPISDECCGPMIYLNEDQCEALGISNAPEVGKEIVIKARAIVTRTETKLEEEGEKENCLCLEITYMQLGKFSEGTKETGSLLYGE